MPKPKILVGKRVPANLLAAMAGPALTGVGPNPNRSKKRKNR